jgi:hypothetical protein
VWRAAGVVVDVLDHRPGDRDAVVGAGAAPDLVQDQQAALGGVVQDVGRLDHLDHKGRLPGVDLVLRADAGEDAVDQPDAGRAAGTKLPICAISTISATWRRKVLLPLMFGPVITRTISPGSKMASLGTKRSPPAGSSTTGWRPSRISSTSPSVTSGRT